MAVPGEYMPCFSCSPSSTNIEHFFQKQNVTNINLFLFAKICNFAVGLLCQHNLRCLQPSIEWCIKQVETGLGSYCQWLQLMWITLAALKWKPVRYIINVQITRITGYVVVLTFRVYFTSSHTAPKQKCLSPCRRKEMQNKRGTER